MLIVCVSTSFAQSKKSSSKTSSRNNWGLGLRFGDPTGVTAKKYLGNGRALEFNLGSSSYWGYDYSDYFYSHRKYDGYNFVGYKRNGAVSLQAHYLWQKDIKNARGLQWYIGVGPQFRFNTYTLNYRYDGGNAWIYVSEKVTEVDFGADGVIGLEYTIPDAPVSLFVDGNLLIELVDDPFIVFGQGGIGIRYNFK